MEDRFEELLNHWAQAFWLVLKLLQRVGVDIAIPDPQIPGITRPAVARALYRLDGDAIPAKAFNVIAVVITKWLVVADLLDRYENEPEPWREAAIIDLLIEAQAAYRNAMSELDRRDQAN